MDIKNNLLPLGESKKLLIFTGILLGLIGGLSAVYFPIYGFIIGLFAIFFIFINFRFYLFFVLIFSQIYVGVFLNGVLDGNYGSIDNIIKTFGITTFSVVLILLATFKGYKLLKTSYFITFLFSAIYFFLGSFRYAEFNDAFYILKIIIPTLVFIVITMFYHQINWYKVYNWMKVFIIVNLIFCIMQVIDSAMYDISRGSGLTPSRNTFSMLLVFLFDFLIILSILTKKKISLIFIGILVIMEFLSYGRAGWGIFSVSFILLLLYYRQFKILILGLIVLSPIIYFNLNNIMMRLQYGEGTSTHRDNVKELLLYYANDNKLFGYGFGWAQKFLDLNPAISKDLTQPHNDFIRLYVDIGLIGLILFLIPYLLIAYRGFKFMLRSYDKDLKIIGFILLLSVGQMFAFMKVYNTIDMFYASTMLVWIFAAIIEMEYRKRKSAHLSHIVQ